MKCNLKQVVFIGCDLVNCEFYDNVLERVSFLSTVDNLRIQSSHLESIDYEGMPFFFKFIKMVN